MGETGWSIVLLDHFHLRHGGGERALTSRKSVAILAYLAVQRDRSARRDVLASLLWENVELAQARISLRQALAAIRKAEGDAEPILITDGDYVRLAPGMCIDIDALSPAAAIPSDAEADRKAAAAYVTDFLAGFVLRDAPAFSEWMSITQAHYRQRAVAALAGLVDAAQAPGGDLNDGISAALRLLSIDTFNESAVRGLMRLYAGQGRAGMALSHYRHFASLLRRELQVAPEAATQELFQAIIAQRRASDGPDAVINRRDVATNAIFEEEEAAPDQARLEPQTYPKSPAAFGTTRTRARSGLLLPATTVIVALLAMILVGYAWTKREAPPTVARLRLLVGSDRSPEDIALSPAGDSFVFSGGDVGAQRLLLTTTQAPDAVLALTGRLEERYPCWSPNGREIVFVRSRGSMTDLVVRQPSGGHERVIATVEGRLATPAWSPDARTVYVSFSPPRSPWFRLRRFDLGTRTWRPITGSEAGHSQDLRAVPSPDGDRLLFVRRSGYALARVFIRDLTTGETGPVAGQRGDVFKAVWRPDGKAIVYSAKSEGESALWFLPLRGSAQPTRLTIGLEDYRDLSSSASGRRLASLTSRDVTTFWTVGSGRSPDRRVQVDGLLTVPGDRDPERNGRGQISFVSGRAGDEQIWLRMADGRLRQLTRTTGLRYSGPEWSPRGDVIAVSAQLRGGSTDLYLIDPASGSMRRLTKDADAILTGWSNDGRYLYYRGEQSSGGMWRFDVLTGGARKVTGVGYAGMPTPDGKGFVYVKSDLSRVWRRSFDADGRLNGPEVQLLDDLKGSATITGDSMVYLGLNAGSGDVVVRRYDFATGRKTDLASLHEPVESIALAPDGAGGVIFTTVDEQRQVSLLDLE